MITLDSSFLVLFIVTSLVSPSLSICNENFSLTYPNILYVGGSGYGNYSSIQQAIDNASSGDTIFVYHGLYVEHVIIDKTINLIGEDRNTTIIDGDNCCDIPCVYIAAPFTNITGFTLRWADWEHHEPAIEVHASNACIYGNNITSNDRGVSLFPSSNGCIIRENIFYGNHYGVITDTQGSFYHLISNNSFIQNDIPIYMRLSSWITIEGNLFYLNGWQAVLFEGCSRSIIKGNDFIKNGEGISIKGNSDNNTVFHNNFINNYGNAEDAGVDQWDNGMEGNYWSDYNGIDSDGDGIGDTPYKIPGGRNIDRYPFIEENGWIPFTVDAHGPYESYIDTPVQFISSVMGGKPPYTYYWDFGDGSSSMERNPIHIYTSKGLYNVTLTVFDSNNYSAFDETYASIIMEDITPPLVNIIKPKNGFYINDNKIFSIPFHISIIIGNITIEVEALDDDSGIASVDFIIDGEILKTCYNPPYTYKWINTSFGLHQLVVIAYDKNGNDMEDTVAAFKVA